METLYFNCQIYDSPYSILVALANSIQDSTSGSVPPQLGWPPLDRIFQETMARLNRARRFFVLVLDEIDKIVTKNGGDSLYVLLKLIDESGESKLSLIGITNDTGFLEFLDSRVRSRLNQESIFFPPYNATELIDIISFRIKGVVRPGSVEDSAINLCAAIGGAQEHGDARKALDLMRIAIDIAVREGKQKVTEKEVYKARDKLEMDVIKEAIYTLPLQSKIVMLSAVVTQEQDTAMMTTGQIYENYRNICEEIGYPALTSRRVSDLISELEDFGLLSAMTKSMGRYGRTRLIRVVGDHTVIKNHLLEDENLAHFKGGSKIPKQSKFENLVEENRKISSLDDLFGAEPDKN